MKIAETEEFINYVEKKILQEKWSPSAMLNFTIFLVNSFAPKRFINKLTCGSQKLKTLI